MCCICIEMKKYLNNLGQCLMCEVQKMLVEARVCLVLNIICYAMCVGYRICCVRCMHGVQGATSGCFFVI